MVTSSLSRGSLGPIALLHVAATAGQAELLCEDGIVYKVADNQHERAGAFRVVYDSYVHSGLMRPNFFELRLMPQHLLATTAVFVAMENERVIATVTLVGDGRLGLPMESVYPGEVNDLRLPSRWIGEVSALANTPGDKRVARTAVIRLMQMTARFSVRHGIDDLLIAVHPRHARFYQRAMGFRLLAGKRAYPAVRGFPAVALHLDLSCVETERPECCDLLFGKRIADDHLRFCPISAAERRHFALVLASAASQDAASAASLMPACA